MVGTRAEPQLYAKTAGWQFQFCQPALEGMKFLKTIADLHWKVKLAILLASSLIAMAIAALEAWG